MNTHINMKLALNEGNFFQGFNLNVNPAKSWKVVNRFLSKSVDIPALKDEHDNLIFDPVAKANILNSHFGKAFSGSDDTPPSQTRPNLNINSFFSLGGFNFCIEAIVKVIRESKPSSAGPDNVDIKTLRLLPNYFAPYLY